MNVVLVGLAGAAGVLSRYGIGTAVGGSRPIPWATLAINLVGSFLLGVVVTTGAERDWGSAVTAPLTVGFLGGFTTFSAFSFEVFDLLRADRAVAALGYVGISMVGGLACAALGYLVGRQFA